MFWISYTMLSVKLIQHKMRYLDWFSHGKKSLVIQDS